MDSKPQEGQCAFYLKRKNRFCRFRPNKGQTYCAEHCVVMGVQLDKKRIVCPLNSTHTCYEADLEKHLKKCNNRRKAEEVYYVQGINSGSDTEEEKVSINDISKEELNSLINKINKLYEEYIGNIQEEILTHSCLNKELENESYGTAAMRHKKQQASLVGHIDKLGLIDNDTRYIEMGAGKGQLSHWLQQAVTNKENVGFLLVDKGSARYKYDCYHKAAQDGPQFERLKIDIEHLDLDKVESIEDDKKLVAIGKHLCGAATDLTLRCLLNQKQYEKESEPPSKRPKTEKNIKGIVIALCCHHRCTWKSYVGKDFMRSNQITNHDFNIMLGISSWATCTWKGWKSQEKDKKPGDSGTFNTGDSDKVDTPEQIDETDEHEGPTDEYKGSIKLDNTTREEIGRKCKRLLDYGRIQYLLKHNMTAHLKSYIDNNLTPENVVLLATK